MTIFSELKNIFIQTTKFKRFLIIANKVKKRIFDKTSLSHQKEIHSFLESNLSEVSIFAKSLDENLWQESKLKSKEIESFAKKKLKNINYDLGGGGIYPLLYFLTRFIKAQIIVETGVASGYSSAGILKGIYENKFGKLYSSDFPYFRLRNPEQYIGIIVEDYLKQNWNLYIEGDQNNLKKIILDLKKKGKKKIDLFHYDSDKSYSGRNSAIKILDEYLKEDTVIVMDDIQDNKFFEDYITKNKIKNWKVFKFKNKYVGLISSKLI